MAAKQAVKETLPAIQTDDRLAKFREAAASMMAVVSDDGQAEIIIQIMEAKSIDDMLGGSVTGIRELLNKPFTVDKVTLRKSDYEDGIGAYAIINATMYPDLRGNREQVVISTGSETVLAQLVKAQMENWTLNVQCVEAKKPTAAGYYPLRLVSAPVLEESF